MKHYFFEDKKRGYIYNQNLSNSFSSDCTIATQFQIIGLQYDVWLWYSVFNRVVDYFIKVGKLLKWGASFSIIYWAFAILIGNRIKEKVYVEKLSIYSDEFERQLKKWFVYWLWLKNGNWAYLNLFNWERTKIRIEDVDAILEQGGGFWHNHAYVYTENNFYIYEIYKGERIKMSLEVLRYAVSKGLYFSPARTLRLANKQLEQALFDYKAKKNVYIQNDEIWNVYNKASQLRVFKEEWKEKAINHSNIV